MRNRLSIPAFRIPPGQTRSVTASPGDSLFVVSGLVWATQTGNPADLWLAAGHRYMLEGHGTAVVEAPRGATVALVRGRPRKPLEALAARWRCAIARLAAAAP